VENRSEIRVVEVGLTVASELSIPLSITERKKDN